MKLAAALLLVLCSSLNFGARACVDCADQTEAPTTMAPTLAGFVFRGTGAELKAICDADSNLNCCMGKNACDFDVEIQIAGFDGDSVGWNVCNGLEACHGFTGSVINQSSCRGNSACKGASGTILELSCNARNACNGSTGDIGSNSCNSRNSCQDNTGTILDDSCNARDACKGNSGFIGQNSCNTRKECLD